MPKEMQAVGKLYDLILWTLPIISRMPRSHKFTIGDRMENLLLDTLELLIEATYTRDGKRDLLRKANLNLEKLRYMFRLCKDIELVNLKRYEHASRCINEVGKLVGGWIKKL